MCRRIVSYYSGLILSLAIFSSLPAGATEVPEAQPLWAQGAPGAPNMQDDQTVNAPVEEPTLKTYLPEQNTTHTAILLIPGGAYRAIKEENYAGTVKRFTKQGITVFFLRYRLGPAYQAPTQLLDAQRAIRTIRSKADGLGINSDRIGVLGVSAGGHLAASIGTLYDQFPAKEPDDIDKFSARPNFLILTYPVITMEPPIAHNTSRQSLLGKTPTTEQVEMFSVEKQVTADTPPTFIVSSTDDPVVQSTNSVLFYSALVAKKVPAELHLFAHGLHGDADHQLQRWTNPLIFKWLNDQGLLSATSEKADVAPTLLPSTN